MINVTDICTIAWIYRTNRSIPQIAVDRGYLRYRIWNRMRWRIVQSLRIDWIGNEDNWYRA